MAEKNEQYISVAKNIIKLIIKSGAEAYIVGESLRDILLDNHLNEIEIFASLPKENAKLLFCDYSVEDIDEYTIFIKYLGFEFRLSLNRPYQLMNYGVNKVIKRHYSTSLMEFLEHKDYTINALAMGVNNIIYDCFSGREDLNKKKLRMINDNPGLVFMNSPIKILEGIALVSELGYRLDNKILSAMRNKARLVKNCSLVLVAPLIKRIYQGKYFKKALRIMIKTKVYKKLDFYRHDLKRLYSDFRKEDYDIFVTTCLVRKKVYNEIIGKTSDNPSQLQVLFNLAMTNPKGKYDILTLYSSGLDLCLKANEVNYLLGKSKKKIRLITKDYKALPIKKTCDLAFKGEDVLKISKELDGPELEELVDEIVLKVVTSEIPNNYDSIKDFAMGKIKTLLSNDFNMETNNEDVEIKEENNNQAIDDLKDESLLEEVNNEEVIKEEVIEEPQKEETRVIEVKDYEELRKRQEELLSKVNQLELNNLQNELEKEIERKIKQSGLLDGLTGSFRSSTYETLQRVYYDVLINSEKYEKLRGKNNE